MKVHHVKSGEFAAARNAPPVPFALLPSKVVFSTSVSTSLLRCIAPPSRPAVLPTSDDAFSSSGVKTACRPPPSSVALFLSMALDDAIESCSAPLASMQPPYLARFSVQLVERRAIDEYVRTEIAPPPPLRAALFRNAQRVTASDDERSTSSAPPSPTATAQPSNVDVSSVASTVWKTSARAPSAEKWRSDSATTLCVRYDPVMVTAAPTASVAPPPPRKRKPVSSKRVGEDTAKHTPVLHTSSQHPIATSEARGGAAQRMATALSSGVAIGSEIVCAAQLNVATRVPPPIHLAVPRSAPTRMARPIVSSCATFSETSFEACSSELSETLFVTATNASRVSRVAV